MPLRLLACWICILALGGCSLLASDADGTDPGSTREAVAAAAFERANALLAKRQPMAAVQELRRCVEASSRVEYHVSYQDVAHGLPAVGRGGSKVAAPATVAMREFYHARHDDGKSPLSPFLRARLQRLDRREEPARLLLEEALTRSRNYYPAQLELGVLWRGVQRYAKAAEWFRLATVTAPRRPAAHLALAEVAGDLGLWKEAVREFDKYLQLVPNDRGAQRSYLSLLLYRVDGDVDEMDRLVTDLLAADPDDVGLRMDRAAVYWRQNELAAAIGEYRAVLRRSVQQRSRAALNLGNLFYARGMKRKPGPPRRLDLERARMAYRYVRDQGAVSDAFDWFDQKLAVRMRLQVIAEEVGGAGSKPVSWRDL